MNNEYINFEFAILKHPTTHSKLFPLQVVQIYSMLFFLWKISNMLCRHQLTDIELVVCRWVYYDKFVTSGTTSQTVLWCSG